METGSFRLTLRQVSDYRMVVDFDQDGVEPLLLDEPPPLGEGSGPNASRLLAAAVGNCLSASLLFCLRKSRLQPGEIHTTVEGTLVRNEKKRLRIGKIRVTIEPTVEPGDRDRMSRCLELFEGFCLVTESVRNGIDVEVSVEPREAGTMEAADA